MLHLTKILALVLILVLILKINEVIMIIPTILAQTVTSCQKELLQTNSSRIVHTNTVTGGVFYIATGIRSPGLLQGGGSVFECMEHFFLRTYSSKGEPALQGRRCMELFSLLPSKDKARIAG